VYNRNLPISEVLFSNYLIGGGVGKVQIIISGLKEFIKRRECRNSALQKSEFTAEHAESAEIFQTRINTDFTDLNF
jgi:hypothetical protein